MSKRRVFLLALAVVLLAGCATNRPADAASASTQGLPFAPGFIRETRIVYPLEVGEWQAVDEHVYDDQALGVMVRYANGDDVTRLDVFYYPAGPLMEEGVTAAAEVQRQTIALAREQSGDPAPDLGPLRAFTIESLPDPIEGHSMDALLVDGDVRYSSAMVLLHRSLYFVKARMSQPAADAGRDVVRGRLEAFMGELVPRVSVVNTGGCARELAIEPWAGDTPPTNAMVTVENGDSLAWVLPDRVVATNTASEQAALARAVGMAFQGRLPPDCMGPDPIEPVVDEGMREIRIEYRDV